MQKTQPSKRVAVITLGCSKNVVDSEHLMGEIQSTGLQLVREADEADAVVINTCGFIDLAKEESVQAILEGAEMKKQGRIQELIVAGCLSDRYTDDLKREIPEVDHFFGTEAISSIVKTLAPDLKYQLMGERILTTPNHFAYLKISEGCDNPCSFCAIPLMRGGHRSKPIEQVVKEMEGLTKQGVKEFVVVAQDLTYYGKDLYGKRNLADLLRAMSDVDGAEWIRLMYAYPSRFPKDILPVIRERSNICNYMDMPLQHSHDDVLKSMRRGITRRTTGDLLKEIRDEVPDIALRTTFIVGYPNETEERFEDLADFVREHQFERMGVFEYSREDDTFAHILGNPVTQEVKARRRQHLMDIQKEIAERHNEKLIGTVQDIIVDEFVNGEVLGRTQFDAPEVDQEVHVVLDPDHSLQVGDIMKAEITDYEGFEVFAKQASA